MSCNHCVFVFDGDVDKIQHLENAHKKLQFASIAIGSLTLTIYGNALKAHYIAKHTLKFSFCNKPNCISPIFENNSSHECVWPKKSEAEAEESEDSEGWRVLRAGPVIAMVVNVDDIYILVISMLCYVTFNHLLKINYILSFRMYYQRLVIYEQVN